MIPRHRQRFIFGICVSLFYFACSVQVRAADVTLNQRVLHVADGYEVELAAAPPLIERPISIARDFSGRLYVTDSGGITSNAAAQLAAKPHRVRVLEDSKGTGKYDKSTLFAEHMMFPEGALFMGGSLYVAAPPEIWKLTNVDGNAEHVKREVWFDGKTITGCGNDLHGPYLGRDGWVYWCKGAFAKQKYTLAGGRQLQTNAAHIFRSRPDGSGLEPVMTGGMDNPVGVAQLANGELILSCTFFQQPQAGRRDGLIHVMYGGLYGKQHDVLKGHVATGSLMPVLVHEAAAAPCGIAVASRSLWDGQANDRVIACYFNLRKVVIHELVRAGATYTTRDTDLISCEHPDFHPTDVMEDADGSLLVVDTGGWYKVCCPTSVLAKPEVLGAIYRIRRQGQQPIADPLGQNIAFEKLSANELTGLLADPRDMVRKHAVSQLRELGAAAVPALAQAIRSHTDANVRREAVWALSGIDGDAAREAVRQALSDQDATTRLAAIHVAGLWRDGKSFDALCKIMQGPDPSATRVAAESLGRIGNPGAVAAISSVLANLPTVETDDTGSPLAPPDRTLEHSLIYALIELKSPEGLAPMLAGSPRQCRAALVALDQMENAKLEVQAVSPLLDSSNDLVRRTANWVVAHHPDWGAAMAQHFASHLAKPPSDVAQQAQLATQLANLISSAEIQDVLLRTLAVSQDPAAIHVVLQAMREAKLGQTPSRWEEPLAKFIETAKGTHLADAVSSIRTPKSARAEDSALTTALLKVASEKSNPAAIRLDALRAMGDLKNVDAALFSDLLAMLNAAQPMDVRRSAGSVLSKANLSDEQYLKLASRLRDVGGLEASAVLQALTRATPSEALGLAIIDSITHSRARQSLRYDLVKNLIAKYPPGVQAAGVDLLAKLNASASEQAAHLVKLAAELPKGDVRRGHEIFESARVGCANCHNIGYRGGQLGPDLSAIGKVRNQGDLLEAIVYPSASFARGYEPVIVGLQDGDLLTGIVASESQNELTLKTGPEEVRVIPLASIVEVRPGTVSPMPDGFETILTKQELADLIAFLSDRK